MKHILPLVVAAIICSGCSSLLPKRYEQSHSYWEKYEQVDNIGKRITAGKTLDDLAGIGVDIYKTQNVEHLTHLDVAKRFGLLGFKDESLKTPVGVKKMLEAAERGRGYELTVNNTVEVREGSFWKDFLNFRKVTRKTGWEYKILIITVDDTVQYVLHKGNPNINNVVIEKNPLGPFQRVNGYVLVDLLENVLD